GLWVVFAAFAVFALADARLAHGGSTATHLLRIAQFLLVFLSSQLTRRRLPPRRLLVATIALVSGIYVTSAIAGALRRDALTQPITDLVIAFATATTLPWGTGPQVVTVLVAMAAMAGNVWCVAGGFAGVSAHLVAGLLVAFATSVYIAGQLARYRRDRDAAEAAGPPSEARLPALLQRAPHGSTNGHPAGILPHDSPPGPPPARAPAPQP